MARVEVRYMFADNCLRLEHDERVLGVFALVFDRLKSVMVWQKLSWGPPWLKYSRAYAARREDSYMLLIIAFGCELWAHVMR